MSGLRASMTLIGALALCLPCHAGGVRRLGLNTSATHASIVEALAAAAPGDLLIVTQGSYPGFTVDAKDVSIIAAPGHAVSITGPVVIRNTTSQNVVIVGLQVAANTWGDLLVVTNSAGHVRLQDCSFICTGLGINLQTAAKFDHAERVTLVRCAFRGMDGIDWTDGYAGGAGMKALFSKISLFDCDLRGGDGGDWIPPSGGWYCSGGMGGAGLETRDSELFLSGCSLSGGAGGYAHPSCDIGPGWQGYALDVPYNATAAVSLLDCSLSAPQWSNIYSGPTLLPGSSRHFQVALVGTDLGPLPSQVDGVAGDGIYLRSSEQFAYAFAPPVIGPLLVPLPAFQARAPLLTLGTGPGLLRIPQPPLPVNELLRKRGHQCAHVASAATYLGPVEHAFVINQGGLPDCDGDGVQDDLATMLGWAPDANHNLVPDGCPGG